MFYLYFVKQTNFVFNHYNSGFFYYNKYSDHVRDFIELCQVLRSQYVLNDKEIRKRINKTVSWSFWYYVLDEVVLQYMWQKKPDSVNKIPYHEHGFLRDIKTPIC